MAANLPWSKTVRDALKSIHPWVVFAGCVLIVTVLYWAQAVLVPVALAILLTFFLTPVVTPDLPPSSPSKARYLVKRLRAAVPDAKIIVGRWAPPSLADEQTEPILGAGAAYVSTTLLETREQLYQLVPMLVRQPTPGPSEVRVSDAA